jgi:hypothetical protein
MKYQFVNIGSLIFDLKRIAQVVTRDLRITGEVDDTFIGDLNTYFDFAKFTKA